MGPWGYSICELLPDIIPIEAIAQCGRATSASPARGARRERPIAIHEAEPNPKRQGASGKGGGGSGVAAGRGPGSAGAQLARAALGGDDRTVTMAQI